MVEKEQDMKDEIAKLERGIKKLEAETKSRQEKRNELSDKLWKIKKRFVCPEGLEPMDAICPGCAVAMPTIVEQPVHRHEIGMEDRWIRTGCTLKGSFIDHSLSLLEIDLEGRYCNEWEKKDHSMTHGCGGSMKCICGYKTVFCFIPGTDTPVICPYCERKPEVKIYQQPAADDLKKLILTGITPSFGSGPNITESDKVSEREKESEE